MKAAYAHAAFILRFLCCELLLPWPWGHDFNKNAISNKKGSRAANDMPLALFWHLFGRTFGGQVAPVGVIFWDFFEMKAACAHAASILRFFSPPDLFK